MNYSTTIFLTFLGLFFSALSTQSFAEVSKEESLVCNKDNYPEYIYNQNKTVELIKSTGRGCNLSGAKLGGLTLRGAYLREANLKKAD